MEKRFKAIENDFFSFVVASDGKKVGMVTGDNQQEMEDWLEKELEWYGERAVVEEMISSDGQFKVRKIGYNDEYHEYEAYIDRVSDDRYVRTVRAKTIDNLGDKVKNVLEQLSSDYNRFR